MKEKNHTLDGYITEEDRKIPVQITYSSKYTAGINFTRGDKFKNGTEFSRLIVKVIDSEHDLGPCRLISTNNKGNREQIIILLTDIFDFHSLLHKNELINLMTLANNREMILKQKEIIKNSFKEYTADLMYDVKVYKHFFDELDESMKNEPASIRKKIFRIIIDTEGKEFANFFNKKIKEMEKEIKSFTREEHKAHGFYLRKQIWDLILCSEFMTRTNIKPRGYIGDSETMRMIYENKHVGDSTFSKLLYKFSLEHPAAQAVRNRRLLVPRALRDLRNSFHDPSGSYRFMSVACGPAYELFDIFIEPEDASRFQCTLLDQDTEALNEARINIGKLEKKIGIKTNVTLLQDSVRTMLRTKKLDEIWGKFNFIYSMGLFDYLTPPVAKAVIENIYHLLKPGGRLMIGNFHVQNPSRWFMEYWHDWVLYYRSVEDFIDLLCDTDAEDITVEFEDTKSQMFLMAKKPVQ